MVEELLFISGEKLVVLLVNREAAIQCRTANAFVDAFTRLTIQKCFLLQIKFENAVKIVKAVKARDFDAYVAV